MQNRPASGAHAGVGPSRAQVEEQLRKLLSSTAFRGSQRCSEFLQYVVSHTLDGNIDVLRERVLAMDLFGRPTSWDPGVDSVVRVKASEVRKRLAQYYADPKHRDDLRIDIPTGSYIPEFSAALEAPAPSPVPAPAPVPPPIVIPRRSRHVMLAITAAALAVACAVWLLWPARTPLDRFWAPMRKSSKPVMITLGNAPVYTLSERATALFPQLAAQPVDTPGPVSVQPDSSVTLHGDDLVPQQGQFVGVGGAQAVLRFSTLLTTMGKSCFLRTGTDFSFNDLRDHPTILVGAFSNRWTLRASRGLRFTFETIEHANVIRDTMAPGRVWKFETAGPSRARLDYAIVSRILRSETGQPLIVAAGITQYGCTSAAEFLTDPDVFEQALKEAPSDWPSKNLQVVIRSPIVSGTPATPEVVATHFW